MGQSKRAGKPGDNVSVVWLDLANAYGAVPHPLIWKALKAFTCKPRHNKDAPTVLRGI